MDDAIPDLQRTVDGWHVVMDVPFAVDAAPAALGGAGLFLLGSIGAVFALGLGLWPGVAVGVVTLAIGLVVAARTARSGRLQTRLGARGQWLEIGPAGLSPTRRIELSGITDVVFTRPFLEIYGRERKPDGTWPRERGRLLARIALPTQPLWSDREAFALEALIEDSVRAAHDRDVEGADAGLQDVQRLAGAARADEGAP